MFLAMFRRRHDETLRHIAEMEAESARLDDVIFEAEMPPTKEKKKRFEVPILNHVQKVADSFELKPGVKWQVDDPGTISHISLSAACHVPLNSGAAERERRAQSKIILP